MRRSIFCSAFVLIVLALAPPGYAADFGFRYPATIVMRGAIAPGDEKTFQSLIERRDFGTLELFSNGGDVETALKIGHIIRSKDLAVSVPKNGYCGSACIFLLAAGVERWPVGKAIIHRPYFTALDPALSSQQVDAKYKKLVRAIYKYLKEMNVPTALADATLSIPPNEAHVLSDPELARYMFDQRDPSYDERETAKEAAQFRISSAELRRRTLLAEKQCVDFEADRYDPLGKYEACKIGSILSLPLAEARRRLSIWGKTIAPQGTDLFKDCFTDIVVDGRPGCEPNYFGDIRD